MVSLRNLSPAAPMPNDPPRYMDVAGVAHYLQRSENAIRHLVKSASIPYAKLGRRVQFDREAIDKWVARNSRRAA